MKRILFILLLSLLSLSCTDEIYKLASVEGIWSLTGYNVEEAFDINNDGIKSINLLEEIECANNEILIFESNGVMSSNSTFNPSIIIALINGTTYDYMFNVQCDLEGVVGIASSYSQNDDVVRYNNHIATIIDNQLNIVFKDAMEIFNMDIRKC